MKRPELTNKTELNVFLSYYWLKKELIEFCSKYSLSSSGSKEEISKRIKFFLKTGKKESVSKNTKSSIKDSDNLIKLTTKVINYRNDTATRKFFTEHIGIHFRFNAYLRQFSSNMSINKNNLTYGDLIQGWLKAEELKNEPDYKSKIGSQFEYNQFIRDFCANEKQNGLTLKDAITAWKKIKEKPGKRTYQNYKKRSLRNY